MKQEKGVTLVTLVITVILLVILAGITVYSGADVIKRANLESMRTNMLLIQAKAKEYVEEADFKMGPNPTNEKKGEVMSNVCDEAGLKSAYDEGITTINGNDTRGYYLVTEEAYSNMGLNKIKEELKDGEAYLLKFDIDNLNVEVYNTIGYEGKYSLTDLEEIQ